MIRLSRAMNASILVFLLFCGLLYQISYAYKLEFKQIERKCAEGCYKRGNCNIEDGRCECKYGYSGPTCEIGLISSCQAIPDSEPFLEHFLPKSCPCLEELVKFYRCDGGACSSAIYYSMLFSKSRCFKYANGTDFKYSDIPEANDTNIRYFRRQGLINGAYTPITDPNDAFRADAYFFTNGMIKPFRYCPSNCSFRGSCVSNMGQAPVCHCMQGYQGGACELNSVEFCISNCNGRGQCNRGFCHCTPPYFGIDCSRSKAFEPVAFPTDDLATIGNGSRRIQGLEGNKASKVQVLRQLDAISNNAITNITSNNIVISNIDNKDISSRINVTAIVVPNTKSIINANNAASAPHPWPSVAQVSSLIPHRHTLKVYIYELPSHVSFNGALSDVLVDRTACYRAYLSFKNSLYNDWSLRTENPYEANLFFIPANIYSYLSNIFNDAFQAKIVTDYVRMNYPFFNRSQGHDHFMWYPPDRGVCHLDNRATIANVIKIVHFTLHFNQYKENANEILDGHFPDKYNGCFDLEKDVAAASMAQLDYQASIRAYASIKATQGFESRKVLFFFAGGIRDNMVHYSGNVRQRVFHLIQDRYKDDPTIRFFPTLVPNYFGSLMEATFCLAPYGDGFGVRVLQAVAVGCIPVIIQDRVVQPYSQFLPYHEFSIIMHRSEIPNLIEHLKSYSKQDIARMRMSLLKYHRALFWDRGMQGLAYIYTMKALELKVSNYWANIHRRQQH